MNGSTGAPGSGARDVGGGESAAHVAGGRRAGCDRRRAGVARGKLFHLPSALGALVGALLLQIAANFATTTTSTA
ncbi:MAG: hypothetical protein R3E85_07230 [Planctomycetota bacterium]